MRITHFGWPQRAVNLTLAALPESGDEQTAATVAHMRELALADARDARIADVAGRLPFSSERAYADAAYQFVRRRIRFLRDNAIAPSSGGRGEFVEILIRPADLLAMPQAYGDCDDFAMLAASLLLARGIPCSFATVAADTGDCSRYSHVYVVAHTDAGDVSIDASHGPYAGWEAPNVCGKRRLWRVDSMNGLGFAAAGAANTSGGSAWWDVINRGLDIVGARYGTPENTYIRRPDGSVVTRGSGTMTPTGTPVDVRADVRTTATTEDRTDAWFTAGGSSMLILAALVILALIMMASIRSAR